MYVMYVQVLWKPEESVGFPEAGMIGGCEPHDMGVRN